MQSFDSCVAKLRESEHAALVPKDVPVHGVGHSNGALMHLLISSLHQSTVASNVLMSYNNKEVADAIPIPGAPSILVAISSRQTVTLYTCDFHSHCRCLPY